MGGVRTWQATIEDNRALLTSAGCCQPPRQAASRPARVRSSRACVEPPACLPKLQLRLGHLLVRPARDRRFPSHGGPSRAGDGQLPEQCSCPIPMPVTVRAERVRIACFRHHTAHRPRSAWSRLPRCWASTSPSVRPSAPKAVGAPQHQLPAAPGHGCSPGAAPRVAGRQAPLLPGLPGPALRRRSAAPHQPSHRRTGCLMTCPQSPSLISTTPRDLTCCQANKGRLTVQIRQLRPERSRRSAPHRVNPTLLPCPSTLPMRRCRGPPLSPTDERPAPTSAPQRSAEEPSSHEVRAASPTH